MRIPKDEMKRVCTRVRGLGWVMFKYFSMLLGVPGVKADTMITRFINNTLAPDGIAATDSDEASGLVTDMYNEMEKGEALTHFEHAV